VQARSLLRGVYDQAIDRESAYEKLAERAAQTQIPPQRSPGASGSAMGGGRGAGGGRGQEASSAGGSILGGVGGGMLSEVLLGNGRRDGILTAAAKSVVRSASSSIGREIVRGVLGSLLGGGRR